MFSDASATKPQTPKPQHPRETKRSQHTPTAPIFSLYRPTAPKLGRHGFSLVELMVVIVIIGLLAGAATVAVRSYLIRGKQGVARMEIAKISQALDTYYTEYDRYPSSDEGIESLVEPSDEFADGLLTKLPVDPWGNRYEYFNPGRDAPYEVISYGADGREGGEGADRDLTSAEVDQS